LLVPVAVAGAAVSVLARGALLARHHRPEAPWSPPVDRTPAAARVVAVLRALRHAPG
jgi:hypothetical protein